MFGVCWSPLKKGWNKFLQLYSSVSSSDHMHVNEFFVYKLDIFKKLAVILVWTAIDFSIEVKEISF